MYSIQPTQRGYDVLVLTKRQLGNQWVTGKRHYCECPNRDVALHVKEALEFLDKSKERK